MAKSKYDKDTFPLLAEGFAREGLNDEQIAEKLGITTTPYYNYQIKYEEFREAIKRGYVYYQSVPNEIGSPSSIETVSIFGKA